MPKKNPPNLTRIEESLSGEEIAALNEVKPGLGSKLHRLLSAHGQSLSAQAGHKGPIGVVKQTKIDGGNVAPGIILDGNRISGGAPAVEDNDFVTLKQVRAMLECDSLARTLEGCAGDAELGTLDLDPDAGGGSGCQEMAIGHSKSFDTGMTACHTVVALNEHVYVTGLLAGNPTLEIFRWTTSGEVPFYLVGSLALTANGGIVASHSVLQGHYLYLSGVLFTDDGPDVAGDATAWIIDVNYPDFPIFMVRLFTEGTSGSSIDVQGRLVFQVVDESIRIYDTSPMNGLMETIAVIS